MTAANKQAFVDAARAVVARDGRPPLVALFAFVQAMPYRFPGPRDAGHTLEHGWGTCAGKNYLIIDHRDSTKYIHTESARPDGPSARRGGRRLFANTRLLH